MRWIIFLTVALLSLGCNESTILGPVSQSKIVEAQVSSSYYTIGNSVDAWVSPDSVKSGTKYHSIYFTKPPEMVAITPKVSSGDTLTWNILGNTRPRQLSGADLNQAATGSGLVDVYDQTGTAITSYSSNEQTVFVTMNGLNSLIIKSTITGTNTYATYNLSIRR